MNNTAAASPRPRIGRNMADALLFAQKFPGWHSFEVRCRATRRAIGSLARAGLVRINSCNQFTLARAESV